MEGIKLTNPQAQCSQGSSNVSAPLPSTIAVPIRARFWGLYLLRCHFVSPNTLGFVSCWSCVLHFVICVDCTSKCRMCRQRCCRSLRQIVCAQIRRSNTWNKRLIVECHVGTNFKPVLGGWRNMGTTKKKHNETRCNDIVLHPFSYYVRSALVIESIAETSDCSCIFLKKG